MNKTFTILISCWLAYIPSKAQLINFDNLETGSVTDVDGNVYPTTLIGETWWMATNLRTKHFNDGSEIIQMTEVMNRSDEENNWDWWVCVPRWGYPNLDPSTFDTYGLLYSWFAATDKEHGGICPEGWSLTDTADWFNLGRLIVGEENIAWEEGIRNTPQGGTETYYEINNIKNVGRFLKTDNGELWNYAPAISSDCGAAGLNIVPGGKLNTSNNTMSKLADFWTGVYVHSDSSGQGRRYIHFDYTTHVMSVNWNHNANLQCARCVKHAHLIKLESKSITLDSTANSSETVMVTSNYNWQANTNAPWLSVTQSVASGNGEIIIKAVSPNTAYEFRTDTVFVTMDNAKTKTILVTQAGKAPLFNVSAKSLSVLAGEGSTTSFSISSNVAWTVSSTKTWLTPVVNSGTGNATVTLTAEDNPNTSIRSAMLTVESTTADTLFEITVTQAAKTITAISATKVINTDILLYPNPVKDELNIFSNNEVQQVIVISLSGKTVASGQNTRTVYMEDISPGLYLVKITTANGVATKKILKEY